MLRQQTLIIKKYIDNILKKNFIRLNFFEYVALVLIVKKSKNKFRVCVNYKALNAITIKNRNAFSLIKKTLVQLCRAKIYNKFNIIAIFKKIKIKKNEYKTTFLTQYNLFEYVIMLFDLCNVSKMFQTFINDILRKYLNDFCISYLNNILIYNDNKKNYIIYVSKIFKRLRKTKFFLNIDKLKFFVTFVKYFKLIIIINDVRINSKKIEIILN